MAEESQETSARDRVREKRNARKRRKTRKIALITLSIIGAILLVYSLGFSYFSSHYYPGTRVAGIDAAGMTEEELSKAIDKDAASYVAHVSDGTFNLAIAGSDIDLTWDAQKVAKTLMTVQDASAWPAGIAGANAREQADLGFVFSEEKIKALVDPAVAAYNETARQPVAATLVLDDDSGEFQIVPEKNGTALDAAAVCDTVATSVRQGNTNVKLTQAQCIQPTFKWGDEATQQALERANETLTSEIPVARGQDKLVTLPAKTFTSWLVVQDDLTLAIDQEKAAKWAEEYLWQSTDYSDDANVYVIDTAAFAKALSATITAASQEPVQVPYTTVPRYLSGGGALNPTPWNAELGRYIDIDKKNQVACLYDATGKVLWETIVTTGNEAAGNGTPLGTHSIYDKKTDFVLIGYDKDNDGKPDYENHVDYWMPFNEGIGLHDAAWRSEYGGQEYLENGSGGCVNLPHDAAASLYAMTHENEMVVVHE